MPRATVSKVASTQKRTNATNDSKEKARPGQDREKGLVLTAWPNPTCISRASCSARERRLLAGTNVGIPEKRCQSQCDETRAAFPQCHLIRATSVAKKRHLRQKTLTAGPCASRAQYQVKKTAKEEEIEAFINRHTDEYVVLRSEHMARLKDTHFANFRTSVRSSCSACACRCFDFSIHTLCTCFLYVAILAPAHAHKHARAHTHTYTHTRKVIDLTHIHMHECT